MMPVQPPRLPSLFVSYAREDEPFKNGLIKQLNVLEAQDVISSWHDERLVAGEQWNETIVAQINAARVILLLISPDFLNSQYIRNVEMKRASERHKAGEVIVIPVLVRNVNSWENVRFGDLKLGELNALPVGAKFISQWEDEDDAFADVAGGIQRAVEKLGLNESRVKGNENSAKGAARLPRRPIGGFVARRDAQGRDIVERLQEELAQGNQLVTLLGPGGIGKTTLAAEAARSSKEVFGGRIVWSSAEKRADFTIATLLDDIAIQLGDEGLRTLAPDVKAAQVHALVAYAPTLIVLDNYETIAPDAKKPIEDWFTLAECSALFTSRHKINSTQHIVIDAMSHEEAHDYLERLIAETLDAQIFSEEVRQRIYETAEAKPFVMQWVVAQIDASQEPRVVLEELTQGEGDAAERVFDRSFNLSQLGDDGRAALLALSLFVPSATREALAAVAGFGDDLKRVNEAIKNLRALWLIKGIDENRRFTIEGLTRSLARARLSKDARADAFRQQFVAYFMSYTKAHAQATPEDFAELKAEKDNLLSAIDVAFVSQDWNSVIQIRNVLNAFLDLHGYWDEAIRSGQQALEAARQSRTDRAVEVFAHNLAVTYQRRGELEAARRLYNESLEIARKLGDPSSIAITLHELGRLAQVQGDLAEARRLYDESLEITRKLGNQSGIAITLHQLAILAQDQGDLPEAQRLYHESLEIKRKLDNQSGIASTLHQLAMLAQDQGDLPEAQRLYDESLEIARKLGNPSGIANTLHQLGILAQGRGDLGEARRLYHESLEINRKLGDQNGIGITLARLGILAVAERNRDEAIRLLREAFVIFEKLKSPHAEITRRNLERLEA